VMVHPIDPATSSAIIEENGVSWGTVHHSPR
jgi:hypothetical protein